MKRYGLLSAMIRLPIEGAVWRAVMELKDGSSLDGENMPNPHLQIHPIFIPMTSRVKIWDFRLRISDLWNRYALSIEKSITRLTRSDANHHAKNEYHIMVFSALTIQHYI